MAMYQTHTCIQVQFSHMTRCNPFDCLILSKIDYTINYRDVVRNFNARVYTTLESPKKAFIGPYLCMESGNFTGSRHSMYIECLSQQGTFNQSEEFLILQAQHQYSFLRCLESVVYGKALLRPKFFTYIGILMQFILFLNGAKFMIRHSFIIRQFYS